MAEPFKSELDWSPESWFSKRVTRPNEAKYTDEDEKSLKSHLQEYLDIERNSKANGTWLKMSDGTEWTGDPRSWVMMLSKAFKNNYSLLPWWTGLYGEYMYKAPYDDKTMWFSNNVGLGDYYAHVVDLSQLSNRFKLVNSKENPDKYLEGYNFLAGIPKRGNYRQVPILNNTPEEGYEWTKLPYKLKNNSIVHDPLSKVKTDDVVNWSQQLGDEGVFINDVWDGQTRDTYLSDELLLLAIKASRERNKPKLFQFKQGILPVNEFISLPGFTRKIKFIDGNNGDFDINNPYKYAYNPVSKGLLMALLGNKLVKR